MITVKLDANGAYLVQWPRRTADILETARRYLARQTSLAAELQIKDIPLATIQALYDQASTAAGSATGGETTRDPREINTEMRNNVLDELLNWLQVAALILVMENVGIVNTALQQHGFLFLERNAPGRNGGKEPAPEGEIIPS